MEGSAGEEAVDGEASEADLSVVWSVGAVFHTEGNLAEGVVERHRDLAAVFHFVEGGLRDAVEKVCRFRGHIHIAEGHALGEGAG